MILRPSTVALDTSPEGIAIAGFSRMPAILSDEAPPVVGRWARVAGWAMGLLRACGRLILRHLGSGGYDPNL